MARITGLLGTQTIPPDMQVEPPIRSCFSSTRTLAPESAAVERCRPCRRHLTRRSRSRRCRPMSSCPDHSDLPPDLLQFRSKLAGSIDDCYGAEVIWRHPLPSEAGEMTGNSTRLTYPPDGLGAPKDRHPGPVLDARACRRDRGVLGRRPHLARRGHLLRAFSRQHEGPGALRHERRRRVGDRHGRQVHPRAGIHRGAHAVRPRVGLTHG